mgnify:CR=1 FL=1
MQTGARYQAVLELITDIFKDEQPADGIINEYLRSRKYIGSKDRRFITETTWQIIRNRRKLEFDSQSVEPRKILLFFAKDKLSEIFDGSPYGLAPLSSQEQKLLSAENEQPYPAAVEAECPDWLFAKINDMEFCKALNQPAEADFRANGHSREEVIARLESEGISAAPMPYAPQGFRVKDRFALGNCAAYQDGWFEPQDEASQIAALLCDVRPEHKIIDYCCGAGGKSLALADLLHNQGHILAHDISAKRLENIKPRITRLGVKNIELIDIVATTDRDFDRFIIDAPCSGTGTWRRSPDAKFRLTAQKLFGLNQIQAELLSIAAAKTKIGGRIIYITCSVLPDENEDIINAFLRAHQEFAPLDISKLWEQKINAPYPHGNQQMLRMSPLTTNTDGFFITILEKIL